MLIDLYRLHVVVSRVLDSFIGFQLCFPLNSSELAETVGVVVISSGLVVQMQPPDPLPGSGFRSFVFEVFEK